MARGGADRAPSRTFTEYGLVHETTCGYSIIVLIPMASSFPSLNSGRCTVNCALENHTSVQTSNSYPQSCYSTAKATDDEHLPATHAHVMYAYSPSNVASVQWVCKIDLNSQSSVHCTHKHIHIHTHTHQYNTMCLPPEAVAG